MDKKLLYRPEEKLSADIGQKQQYLKDLSEALQNLIKEATQNYTDYRRKSDQLQIKIKLLSSEFSKLKHSIKQEGGQL